ncbi:MAG TPA: lysine--tRNA ligase [Candidatus Moranbacteria bacterium]|nr:lysine--tRNA ligase [Candidatus Moranbacteria bacterium]
MFWADKLIEQIKIERKEKIESGKPLIVRDEKTASGRVHIGSLRGVAIHGIVSEILNEQGIKNEYLYEINDFDPMDGLPVYLDKEKFEPHMGKPLCNVPSPDKKAKNYAEYFGEEFIRVIEEAEFRPKFYRSSELYKTGKYNEVIKLAIENAEKIRDIYKKISGSEKEEKWLPVQMICEKCGKVSTTRAYSFDGEKVKYECVEDAVKWTKGCGYSGENSPYDGNAKLPWKVEWAAKFRVVGVDIEGAGKDHSTRGGSREIADEICRKIFMHNPPFNIPYEFFQVGGKKMSSSKGAGSSSREIADLLPPELLRLLLLGKDAKKVIDFIPDGDTIPILYDTYDKMAGSYFGKEENDDTRIFKLIHANWEEKMKQRFLPRFSQIAFLVQMPHMDIYSEVEKIKGSSLTKEDKEEVDYRSKYARSWLLKYAPEDYKYELKENEIPKSAKNFTEKQKEGLRKILEYVKSQKSLDGQELHSKIHEIKQEMEVEPKELFSAIYLSFLGKDRGPKVGWFLSVLDKKFLEKRLEEVIK